MSMLFAQLLYIQFYTGQEYVVGDKFWEDAKFAELLSQINYYTVPDPDMVTDGRYSPVFQYPILYIYIYILYFCLDWDCVHNSQLSWLSWLNIILHIFIPNSTIIIVGR